MKLGWHSRLVGVMSHISEPSRATASLMPFRIVAKRILFVLSDLRNRKTKLVSIRSRRGVCTQLLMHRSASRLGKAQFGLSTRGRTAARGEFTVPADPPNARRNARGVGKAPAARRVRAGGRPALPRGTGATRSIGLQMAQGY